MTLTIRPATPACLAVTVQCLELAGLPLSDLKPEMPALEKSCAAADVRELWCRVTR